MQKENTEEHCKLLNYQKVLRPWFRSGQHLTDPPKTFTLSIFSLIFSAHVVPVLLVQN